MSSSRITPADFHRLLQSGLPTAAAMALEIVTLDRGLAVIRFTTGPHDLRPGGTVAGPVLFALADVALYAAVMTVIGEIPLAVTTDASIHFLRRPKPGVLVARASLMKEGKRLVVGEARIANADEEAAPVAHAVMTYSVP